MKLKPGATGGRSGQINVDRIVPFPLQDRSDRADHRRVVGVRLVRFEIGNHGRGLTVRRHQRIDIYRHRRHHRFQLRDLRRRLRNFLHHLAHLHALRSALDVFHLARGKAENIVSDRLRQLLDALLNPLDFRQDIRPVDIALFRNDADQRHIAPTKNLLQQIRGLDEWMRLRRPQIGIGIDLKTADAGHQKSSHAQDHENDGNPKRNDEPSVRAKYARFSFHNTSPFYTYLLVPLPSR